MPQKPKREKTVHLRLPETLYKKIKILAVRQGKSIAEIIAYLLNHE